MALRWDAKNVHDWEGLHSDEREMFVTETLVHYSMGIGMPEVTEQNVDEWVRRMNVLGPISYWKGNYFIPTEAEVRRRVGLRTNVTRLTAKKFNELEGV